MIPASPRRLQTLAQVIAHCLLLSRGLCRQHLHLGARPESVHAMLLLLLLVPAYMCHIMTWTQGSDMHSDAKSACSISQHTLQTTKARTGDAICHPSPALTSCLSLPLPQTYMPHLAPSLKRHSITTYISLVCPSFPPHRLLVTPKTELQVPMHDSAGKKQHIKQHIPEEQCFPALPCVPFRQGLSMSILLYVRSVCAILDPPQPCLP